MASKVHGLNELSSVLTQLSLIGIENMDCGRGRCKRKG